MFFFFGGAMWLAGSLFPNQGSNPGHGGESGESLPLHQQRTPTIVNFNGLSVWFSFCDSII